MTATADDSRLDQLVSGMDQTLVNQTAVNTQLQEQRRQLESQQQYLTLMSQDIGAAIKDFVEKNCPKVEACPAPLGLSDKMRVGALETIWLPDLDVALIARIDTGAKTSSIDASNIKLFERDGKRWVRFEILDPIAGASVSLERRLERTVGIVNSGKQGSKRRPVVKMSVLIGELEQIAEFSLNSGSHKGYQALIGRSILKDVMIVDVSRNNIAPYVRSEMSSSREDKIQ
ncbi:MAG: RimK/LysX family protein [Halioglobus sp.]|nr:RimK/LysX family protein [Halioglobus sp.]